jgi:Fic family protein
VRNRAGFLKAQLEGEARYYTFVPTPLQKISLEPDSQCYGLLARTRHELGVLDVLSSRIPDMDLFIAMYIRKEALLSSQIEGTQATLDDILEPGAERNRNLHVAEVIQYIKAVHFALDRMGELPLCCRLLREVHEILLAEQRGAEKNPGEFRRSQNWIGAGNSTIKTASYVPPCPQDMAAALDDLERFIHDDEHETDPLIQAALIHYQFETIHPFLDGNGRIGRLLIVLFLCAKGILIKPALYISWYLKRNRLEYYDRLEEVRKRGNYEQWIVFFMTALHASVREALGTIEKLAALRERNRAKISALGRSAKSARNLYDYLERSPIIEIGKTAAGLGMSFNTIDKAAEHLRALGILAQTGSRDGPMAARNRRFAYTEYLDILREGAE